MSAEMIRLARLFHTHTQKTLFGNPLLVKPEIQKLHLLFAAINRAQIKEHKKFALV